MIEIVRLWVDFVVVVAFLYAMRHWVFSWRRLFFPQRQFFQDLLDSELPGLTVLVPMHNEELVARDVLDALLRSTYPHDRLEIIPIDDHSEDATEDILREYMALYPLIRPLFRRSGQRTKPAGLNDALKIARHDIILVFDADYLPPRDMLRELATAFLDPEVGAVMGRVIPVNTPNHLLPRLVDLERTGGYQVDQQARYDMDLVVQFGGTVGGFRRSLATVLGGFDPRVSAEDTELTYKLYVRGWKVAYANRAECYEEAPENWDVRLRQLRRWSRGHTQVLFRHLWRLLKSPYLSLPQKVDGTLLSGVYLVSPLLLSGFVGTLILFLDGTTSMTPTVLLTLATVTYNAVGNFAPYYQIAIGGILDRMEERLLLLPFLSFVFPFNLWAVTLGVWDAFVDLRKKSGFAWEKTKRYRAAST